ncbi:hypothetical protein QR680_015624 [Steinernema hermaphroditum]|uniref:RNA-directed DNA polymerase n=1 Tax=Steinernema hermaphroditum TaxID=289476 RepID=A0AA39H8F9_9BILA|nr:hypothetical protein QR680_015624 [Steinernema hermaphroditum]
MKHQDILISKLEAIAFHNLVINNITDLVHPFHLNDLAHQHIQSITSNIGQKIVGDYVTIPCLKRERKLSVSVTNNVKIEQSIPPEADETVVPIEEVKMINSPFSTQVVEKINGINLPMLIDTGATISIAHESMATLLTAKPRRIESAAMGASGQMIQFKSEATVSLEIAGYETYITMYFTDNEHTINDTNYSAIIGCNALKSLPPITFDFAIGQMKISGRSIPLGIPKNTLLLNLPVRACKNYIVPPQRCTVIDCEIQQRFCYAEREFMIHTADENLAKQEIYLTPCVIKPKTGKFCILLNNPTNAPVPVFKGMKIAAASVLKNVKGQLMEIGAPLQEQQDKTVDPTFKVDLRNAECSPNEKKKLAELIDRHNDVFSKNKFDLGSCTVEPYKIRTYTEVPIQSKPYRVPYKYKETLNEHISQLEKAGIIREENTSWLSNLTIVGKKDGSIRPCLDMRKLNEVIVPDGFPIPRLDSILNTIAHAKMFSSLDLNSGFFQIRISPESKEKCGILLENKTYVMERVPFGLKNASAAFGRAMAKVLEGLESDVIVYVDDILVFTKSDDFDKHLKALERVFERFRTFKLKLSPKKCHFAQKSIDFLGHTISGSGYTPSINNVKAIINFPRPKNAKETKRILGMFSFFRRFVPGHAQIVEPLTRLTAERVKFEWTEEQEKAFQKIKEVLTSAPVLRFPREDAQYYIFVDASTVARGALLAQKSIENDRCYNAIAYYSKTLTKAEKKWAAVHLELSSIVSALREFRPYIYGSPITVTVFTDHKPLTYLMQKSSSNACLARWLIELQGYDLKIQYVEGKKNSVADALSRIETEGVTPTEVHDIIEFPRCLAINETETIDKPTALNLLITRSQGGGFRPINMAREQREDVVLAAIIDHLASNKPLQFSEATPESDRNFAVRHIDRFKIGNDNCLYYTFSAIKKTGEHERVAVAVPTKWRKPIFDHMHGSKASGGHRDTRCTMHKLRQYFWPHMSSDITEWCRACITCQKTSHRKAPKVPMKSIVSNTIFAIVAADICGPFPETANGNRYYMNIIDLFSKHVVSIPLKELTSVTVADNIMKHFVLIYGCFTELLTDNASIFTSQFFKYFCALLEIDKIYSTPYHHQGNGAVERSFRTFNLMLRKTMQNSTSDFDELLPYTQWVYNTSISSVTHETPFTLVFGREPIMALDKILNPRSHETFNSEQIEEFRETLFVNLRESWIAAHENAEIDRQKRKEKYDESASETTIKVDQLMSVRGQVHHLDRPAPYTAIACTRGKAVLALTDLTIEAPVVVDIASTTNFVGPAPTLYNYPVLPGETFNLLVYVQRSHPDGGLRRYHGPRTKLASLWMKDCGAFTTNATALVLLRTYCYVMPQRSYCYECLRFRASTSLAQQYIIQKTTSHLQVILTHFLTYTTLSHIGNPYSAVAMVYALHREESSKDDRMEQVDDVQHSVKNDDLITGMPDVRWSPTNKFQLRLLVE